MINNNNIGSSSNIDNSSSSPTPRSSTNLRQGGNDGGPDPPLLSALSWSVPQGAFDRGCAAPVPSTSTSGDWSGTTGNNTHQQYNNPPPLAANLSHNMAAAAAEPFQSLLGGQIVESQRHQIQNLLDVGGIPSAGRSSLQNEGFPRFFNHPNFNLMQMDQMNQMNQASGGTRSSTSNQGQAMLQNEGMSDVFSQQGQQYLRDNDQASATGLQRRPSSQSQGFGGLFAGSGHAQPMRSLRVMDRPNPLNQSLGREATTVAGANFQQFFDISIPAVTDVAFAGASSLPNNIHATRGAQAAPQHMQFSANSTNGAMHMPNALIGDNNAFPQLLSSQDMLLSQLNLQNSMNSSLQQPFQQTFQQQQSPQQQQLQFHLPPQQVNEASLPVGGEAVQLPPETKWKGRGRSSTFPLKLHQMLLDLESKDGGAEIASFLPHGRGFQIHKPKEFCRDIMPNYFRMSIYSSFQRQLNLYDFQRISEGPEKGAYWHELFLKDQPMLSTNMKRSKVKGVTRAKQEQRLKNYERQKAFDRLNENH